MRRRLLFSLNKAGGTGPGVIVSIAAVYGQPKPSGRMPFHCKDCSKHFSVRTGSVFAESNLPLNKCLMAIYSLATNLKGMATLA